jgi:Fe2+ transport system protein FeoA
MQLKSLSELDIGKSAIVKGFQDNPLMKSEEKMVARLMELGFIREALVKVVHQAPFANDPIAVEIRGKKIAIRRADARLVLVQEVS